jgi:hypothetical protein
MTIEVLYFDGCPSYQPLLARLQELIAASGVPAALEEHRIADDAHAQRERFLGSPTVRVDGHDIEPGVDQRADYGMSCRLYRTTTGLAGQPPDEWLVAALDRA